MSPSYRGSTSLIVRDGSLQSVSSTKFSARQQKSYLRLDFFSVSCDEVTTLDTQSWISIHGYVCENWSRKSMLLSLERVTGGSGSNNLMTIIVEAMKAFGGVKEADLAARLASFGAS